MYVCVVVETEAIVILGISGIGRMTKRGSNR